MNGVTGSVSPGNNTVTNAAFRNGENVGVAVYAVSTVNGESVQGTSTSATVATSCPRWSKSAKRPSASTA